MKSEQRTANFESYSYEYFLDLKEKENEKLYFMMKNKYEYSFSKEQSENFIQEVLNMLGNSQCYLDAELLLVPETGNNVLKEICAATGKEVVFIKKASVESIKSCLEKQPMNKSERAKLFSTLEKMDCVKMAGIAGNQRKRFVHCLFHKVVLDQNQKGKKLLFLDDSIFSGYTFLAAQQAINEYEHNNVILFNKNF